MTILDGKKIKTKVLDELRSEVASLSAKLTLVVVQVGNNEASNIYIKQKEKMANYVGYNFKLLKFAEDIEEETLLAEIDKLNNNPEVTGLIVPCL